MSQFAPLAHVSQAELSKNGVACSGTCLAVSSNMENTTEHDVKQLNSFLRGELSAVETYSQCLEKVEDLNVRAQLVALKESHVARAVMLRNRITTLGGEAEQSAGVWGSFAKSVEGGATLFGAAAAVSMLEEGEDHGLKSYREEVGELSTVERSFVQTELLPEQEKSHEILRRIDRSL